jgi:hypothetical protein
MKRFSIGYSDGEKHVSSERFLSKMELREIFPEAEYITRSVVINRKRLHKTHSKDGHAWLRRQRSHVWNTAIWIY